MIDGSSESTSRIHPTKKCRATSSLSRIPGPSNRVCRNQRSHDDYGKWFFAAVAILVTIGCAKDSEQQATRPQPTSPPPPLTILVLDDPPLAAAIERQWAARADGPLRIQQTTTTDLMSERRRHLAADAVIFPTWLIGELAEQNLISPIPPATLNSPEFGRRDIFDLIRQSEIVWGDRVFGVPLGSPVLTLLYRRDIFEAIEANPPETWGEYQKLVQRLSDPHVIDQLPIERPEPWRPVIEPLGDGWASQMLLARAAGYSRHRNYYSTLFDAQTMEPLIAGPPFVRALEELVAVHRGQSSEMLAFGPADARQELLAGRCAMAITWPSRVDERGDPPAGMGVLPLAAAELPGSREVFNLGDQKWHTRSRTEEGRATLLGVSGRLGAVSSFSRQPQAALNLLVSLSSTDWSEQISPFSDSTGLYRSSQIPFASSWLGPDFETARAYGELVRDIQRRPLWLSSLRIPSRSRYLSKLDTGVQAAVAGELEPAKALEVVAEQWREITKELGVQTQRSAYWRSLGMEP